MGKTFEAYRDSIGISLPCGRGGEQPVLGLMVYIAEQHLCRTNMLPSSSIYLPAAQG